MRKIFCFLILLVLFSQSGQAQFFYTVVDPDGYTNVRKEPNSKSEVLGRLSPYQVFTTPDNSCNNVDSYENNPASNWLPVLLEDYPSKIGYVYKKNVASFDHFDEIKPKLVDSLELHYIDGDFRVTVEIETDKQFREKYNLVRSENNEYCVDPICSMYNVLGYEHQSYLKEIRVFYKNKEVGVSFKPRAESDIFRLYGSFAYMDREDFYQMELYKSPTGFYYLNIHGGDGGETYSAMWIITKDKFIYYNGELGDCNVPLPTMY